ncbi:MAG: DUF6279 family lipoprotein [Gammaproteobacteria bacterium]|jgi:hypothetical protein|nr:DUF6279 family lipoprotein [Gammaproteobacteria bacterium]
MRRYYLLCFVTITTLLTTGCSALGFAYNNAPSFVASKLDDAFDLDEAQQSKLDLRLQKFFAWHRQQELPRYQQSMNVAATTIADGITAVEFLEIYDDLRLAWRRSLTQAVDDLGDLALTLSAAQIEHFQQYFHDEAEEYRDYLQMSAQQREIFRVQRGLKRLQDWFGKLDELQREKISLRLQQLPEFYPAWINYREARQRALLDALRAAATEGLSRQQLKFILLDPASDYARSFEPVRRAYWQAYAQAIEEISGLLRKAQLQHAVNRLQDYADTVADLASND